MNAVAAITRSVLRETRRNRTALLFTLLIPVLLLVILGLAFNGGNTLKVGLADQDGSTTSAQFVSQLQHIKGLSITTGSRHDLLQSLHNDSYDIVAVIPSGFGAGVRGETGSSTIAIYQNQNSPQASSLATSVFGQIIAGYNQALTGQPARVSLQTQQVETNNVTALDFLLPSLIAYIVLQAGVQLVAIGLVDLRERGVLRRFLVTPVSPFQVLSGQLLGRAVTVLLEVLVLILVGLELFSAHMYGSWAIAAVAIVVGTVTFVSLGFFITGFARTSDAARGIAAAVTFPMLFLSGVFIPLDQLPHALQVAVHVLPLTFLTDALHQVMNDGAGFGAIGIDLLVLAAWAVACFAIAVRRFQWAEPG